MCKVTKSLEAFHQQISHKLGMGDGNAVKKIHGFVQSAMKSFILKMAHRKKTDTASAQTAVQEWMVMMMRLIDADALIEDIKSFWDWDSIDGITSTTVLKQTITDISHAPTIDAVPVVLCKDCKWWTKQEASIQGRCALAGIYPTGGWYCGNGKREDNE